MRLLERLPLVRKLPPEPSEKLTVPQIVRKRIHELPYMPGLLAFWADLRALERLWPLVLPLLAWVGWRTYHAERRRLSEQRARDL
jgi:hypothetical protein